MQPHSEAWGCQWDTKEKLCGVSGAAEALGHTSVHRCHGKMQSGILGLLSGKRKTMLQSGRNMPSPKVMGIATSSRILPSLFLW